MAKGHKTGGRQVGTPNKVTKVLKDHILEALADADGLPHEDGSPPDKGAVAYLRRQSEQNPTAFLALVGKVLPMQIAGDQDNPLRTITEVRETIVDPGHPGSKGV